MTSNNEANQAQQPQLLDQAKFNAIAGAFARLQQLGEKQIATGANDNSQAEKEQLVEYLATNMLQHIAEFLAAYQLTHTEYLPLCQAVRRVAIRAGLFNPPQPSVKY